MELLMEKAVVYTGCFECDHEMEFHGVVNERDIAFFPCPECGETFEITDWSLFFLDYDNNYEEEDEES